MVVERPVDHASVNGSFGQMFTNFLSFLANLTLRNFEF